MDTWRTCLYVFCLFVAASLGFRLSAADIDEALLAEVYARSKAVSKAYENTIIGVEHTYSFADGRAYPVIRYSIAQKGELISFVRGSSSAVPSEQEEIRAFVAGPSCFFQCQRAKSNPRFLLRDIRTKRANESASDYTPMAQSFVSCVIGTHCIFGTPLWRVQDDCELLKISSCEMKTVGAARKVWIEFAQRSTIVNNLGPTQAQAEIDPEQGWVITMFRHPVVDHNQVTAYSQYDYVYDGKIGGVGRLKAINGIGLEPDAKTRSTLNNEIFRIVEFVEKDLPDSYFTPQAFGIELTDKADRRSYPPIAYLLIATVFLLALYVCLRLRRPRSDR